MQLPALWTYFFIEHKQSLHFGHEPAACPLAAKGCDMYGTPDGCKRGIGTFAQSKGMFRFRCEVSC